MSQQRKPLVGIIKLIAEGLGVSSDYLLEGASEKAVQARIEEKQLLQQFQEIKKMPDEEKTVVKKFLDAFIAKKKIQVLTER